MMIRTIGQSRRLWRFGVPIAAAACLGAAVGWPAQAEDSGFWEAMRGMSRGSESFAPSPYWLPRSSVRRAPRIQRAARPRPQVAHVPDGPAPVLKPPDPSQRPNPLATLLSDRTLRNGDIVMFPEGPRVFRGERGTRHAMADFVAATRSKDLPKATRKVLAGLPVGENNAWSADTASAAGRLAQGAADVDTTGSLPGKNRSRR